MNWASTEDNQAHKDFWRPYWLVVAPNEYGTPSATGQARAQAVCHEMGHTVGFGEYAFGHIGCMGGGTSNGGQIHNEEVAAINYCYAFGSC